MTSFRHGGKCGDVLASLPMIRAMSAEPARLYLRLNGNMTPEAANSLLPLVRAQEYVASVDIWDGQPIDVDLDDFRRTGCSLSSGNLAHYYCHAFPVCPNTWEPWLTVDPDPAFAETIIVNRSSRYHNKAISYSFLAKWLPKLHFIGTPEEYAGFHTTSKLNIPHVRTQDFLAVARAIKACRLFLGNQSACFWIAEALKVNRIVEVYPEAPNVIPCGPGGYQAFSQSIFQRLVSQLL